ncbi:MAG TPA: esterase, partial [Bradyrhizobium sp.]|nr:esterase [Bradyrhizobium sp.]
MSRLAVVATTFALMIAASAQAAEPITLRDMGSFHVGGRLAEISGKPVKEMVFTPGGVPAKVDPNGTYQVEQMYVQYFLPANERGAFPLLMWHGGGLTGVTWETTPDGREGWLNYFLRKGWSVYNSDAVERGRAGWAQYPDIFKSEPVFLTTANPFLRFRIGDGPNSYDPEPAKRKLMPGNLFPNDGYDNFVKQVVPRWTTNDDATIAAYIAEVDRIGPCVIMVHSQSGSFGFKVAQARPDKVKALIA